MNKNKFPNGKGFITSDFFGNNRFSALSIYQSDPGSNLKHASHIHELPNSNSQHYPECPKVGCKKGLNMALWNAQRPPQKTQLVNKMMTDHNLDVFMTVETT